MQNISSEETSEQLIASLKAEKEELEAALTKEQVYSVQLKQELAGAETQNTDLTKASMISFLYNLLISTMGRIMHMNSMIHENMFSFCGTHV